MAVSDALVIGGGPAGASAAILLAQAGWRVTLVEQHAYPRQKVCGECFAAGSVTLLDELGVGEAFRRLAGPPLEQVGWMRGGVTVIAAMPPCPWDAAGYGRALGRDVFDALLLERARMVGVRIVQPARLRSASGLPGSFRCHIEHLGTPQEARPSPRDEVLGASIIIDAHGSWESGPDLRALGETSPGPARRPSDLLAFKATFHDSALAPGLLPVLAVDGGYGGMVVGNEGRTTVALCLRRDALRAIRIRNRGVAAGLALESHLRGSCGGVRDALFGASRAGPWLAAGPLRPGVRLRELPGVFRVGNAAGEAHPLIGEGLSMALQSSKWLVESLLEHADRSGGRHALSAAHHAYADAWRRTFMPRLRIAALYAHLVMRAPFAVPLARCLIRSPGLLTAAARLAGKARHPYMPMFREELI